MNRPASVILAALLAFFSHALFAADGYKWWVAGESGMPAETHFTFSGACQYNISKYYGANAAYTGYTLIEQVGNDITRCNYTWIPTGANSYRGYTAVDCPAGYWHTIASQQSCVTWSCPNGGTPTLGGTEGNEYTCPPPPPQDCSSLQGQTFTKTFGTDLGTSEAPDFNFYGPETGASYTIVNQSCEAINTQILDCYTNYTGLMMFQCVLEYTYTGQPGTGGDTPSQSLQPGSSNTATNDPPVTTTTTPPVTDPGPPQTTSQTTTTVNPDPETVTITNDGNNITIVYEHDGNKTTVNYVVTTTNPTPEIAQQTVTTITPTTTTPTVTTIIVDKNPSGLNPSTVTTTPGVDIQGATSSTTTTTNNDGTTTSSTSGGCVDCSGEITDADLTPWSGPGNGLLDAMQQHADSFAGVQTAAQNSGLSLPALSLSFGSGTCYGIPYDLGKMGSGTFDSYCDFYDNYARPLLEWAFYIWTFTTCVSLVRESYQRSSAS